jgi:hypothetical protein
MGGARAAAGRRPRRLEAIPLKIERCHTRLASARGHRLDPPPLTDACAEFKSRSPSTKSG